MHVSRVVTVWRPLAMSALLWMAGAAAADAQTVIVRNVVPGEAIEVFVNATPAASGTADASGGATLAIDLRAAAGADEMDSRVYVDVCDARRRILIVNRNIQPPARDEGCERREILGMFWVRDRSTLVVDAGALTPTLLLRQGKYDPTAGSMRVLAPRGVVVFGGGGLSDFTEVASTACGTVQDCDGDASVASVTAGADLWVTRWLGLEGAYLKPKRITTRGAGGFFKFTDTYDVHVLTAAAKLAIPIGRARMYAKGGALFHRATTTSEVTIAEVNQTLRLTMEGWSWIAGGGVEVWISPKFALYGEGSIGDLKGKAVGNDVEGAADARLTQIAGGFRVKIF